MRIKSLFWTIFAGIFGLIVANMLVPGFEVLPGLGVEGEFLNSLRTLVLAGAVLGLINFFVKPLVNLITLPLRWLTLGFFSLLINTGIIWLIDILFSPEIMIQGFKSLLFTVIIVWLANLLVSKTGQKRRRRRRR